MMAIEIEATAPAAAAELSAQIGDVRPGQVVTLVLDSLSEQQQQLQQRALPHSPGRMSVIAWQ